MRLQTKPQEAAIDRERQEAEQVYMRFMMVPGTANHRRYSWLNICLLVYCAFTIPVRVSFDFELVRNSPSLHRASFPKLFSPHIAVAGLWVYAHRARS